MCLPSCLPDLSPRLSDERNGWYKHRGQVNARDVRPQPMRKLLVSNGTHMNFCLSDGYSVVVDKRSFVSCKFFLPNARKRSYERLPVPVRVHDLCSGSAQPGFSCSYTETVSLQPALKPCLFTERSRKSLPSRNTLKMSTNPSVGPCKAGTIFGQEETHAGAGHRQARRDRGGDGRARHSRCGRPPDTRDRAALPPPAPRLRESRDRPGQPPEAPEVGEQPPAASRGGPDAGQPDPEAGVWGIFLGPSRRRRSVDSPDNAATGQPARGRADAPTSCPHHTDLGQSCLLLWRRCSICFVLLWQ